MRTVNPKEVKVSVPLAKQSTFTKVYLIMTARGENKAMKHMHHVTAGILILILITQWFEGMKANYTQLSCIHRWTLCPLLVIEREASQEP